MYSSIKFTFRLNSEKEKTLKHKLFANSFETNEKASLSESVTPKNFMPYYFYFSLIETTHLGKVKTEKAFRYRKTAKAKNAESKRSKSNKCSVR